MTNKRGYEVIRDPLLNKGSAFTAGERARLGITGLLPPQHNTQEQQAERVLGALLRLQDPLDRYTALAALQDRNEYLFYRVLVDQIEQLMPIVYTPTVGLATQNFSQVFQRGRGVWITPDCRGSIRDVLANAIGEREIALAVVTDNESILGIGDQGAGGMAISVGKLSLYVAGAGIAPETVLPISLDVGTNNQALLDDPLYLGWPQERISGAEYVEFIDEFVAACQAVMPGALIQWEDFRKDNALAILDRHRHNVLSFNDDIQGTGAVAVAGVHSGLRNSGGALREQRVVIYGAGAAGLGIARQLRAAMMLDGASENTARHNIAVLDSGGLLVDDRSYRDAYKSELAWRAEKASTLGLEQRDLLNVVRAFQPSVLIGTSGQAGAFDETLVRQVASHCERPIIMPFSNPTANAEATPSDLLAWSDGKAQVATGSPFEPVEIDGRTVEIGQGNNVFIFPGLGFGALQCRATEVTDNMVSRASSALAECVTADELARGLLFPAVTRLREVSAYIAAAVTDQAIADGVAAEANRKMAPWWPDYPEYAND